MLQQRCTCAALGRLCARLGGITGIISAPSSTSEALYNFCFECRRKQRQITLQLDDLGMENLETQLHDATERPSEPRHRFATVIMVLVPVANEQTDL